MNEIVQFAVTDFETWDNAVKKNQDAYGRGVIEYAARWANMVEMAIAGGAEFGDVVGQLSHEADIDGITKLMYGLAVSILSRVWKHGEELRHWHLN